VKDSEGASISDAKVELTREGESKISFTVQSGNDGRFSVSHVPDGHYWLKVKARGFWNADQAFSVQRSEDKEICPNPIRVVMRPAGECSYVENAWPKDSH
jgi:hypothetical protein